MRLGAALPFGDLTGGPLQPDSLSTSAATIEELGYQSVWTFDAVGRGFMLPDPLMALGAVAAATSDVDLGTGILQLPIRNVAEIAHRVFTLEIMAPGRVLLGVGPGSTEADFTTFGGDYGERFATFTAQWDELRSFVSDGSDGDRALSPPPGVAGGPNLMLAAWRGPWIVRAATEAAGWIASGANADDATLATGLERFREAGGQRAVVTNVQVGDDLDAAVARMRHLGDLGFDDVVVVDMAASRDRLAAIRDAVG